MADTSVTKLYTPELLSLATQLAQFPLVGPFLAKSEARSRTCGSVIALGVDLDAQGKVARVGMQVNACAIGQSSAAIMALSAKGRSGDEIADMVRSIKHWLEATEGAVPPIPNWPGFEELGPARTQKGRHGALLLAWTAMQEALSSLDAAR